MCHQVYNSLKKLNKAFKLINEADCLLQEALEIVLSNKDIHLDGFYVCMATGNETVVHYKNDEGCKYQLSDLDLSVMASMSKEEIYNYFNIKDN